MTENDLTCGMRRSAPVLSGEDARRRPFSPDLSRYRRHVAHLDLSPEAEAALLFGVWQVMRNAVDRAFGDDPAQHVQKPEGKSLRLDAGDERPVIDSDINTTTNTIPETTKTLSRTFRRKAAGASGKETQTP